MMGYVQVQNHICNVDSFLSWLSFIKINFVTSHFSLTDDGVIDMNDVFVIFVIFF